MISGRFDCNDGQGGLEISAANFVQSARKAHAANPDSVEVSALIRTSGKDRLPVELDAPQETPSELLKTIKSKLKADLALRDKVLGASPLPHSFFSSSSNTCELSPVSRQDTSLNGFKSILEANLKNYPSAYHVVHLTGHGQQDQLLAGSSRAETTKSLRDAVDNGGRKVDLLLSESCFSAHLDNLAELGQVARIAVMPQSSIMAGSETFGQVAKRASQAASAEELAAGLVESSKGDAQVPILTAFDLEKVEKKLIPSLKPLGRQLMAESVVGVGDGQLRRALLESHKSSDDHTGVDLGRFLENLSDLKLAPKTREALATTITAFKDSRIAHHSSALNADDYVDMVSQDPPSTLRGLSFGIDPDNEARLPSEWKSFVQLFTKPGFDKGNAFQETVDRVSSEALEHFKIGEPVVAAVSTPRAYKALRQKMTEMDLPFITLSPDQDLEEMGDSGRVTLFYTNGKTSQDYKNPAEVIKGVKCEPINYKRIVDDSSAIYEQGEHFTVRFKEPGRASRLAQWAGITDFPKQALEFSSGEQSGKVLEAANYRLPDKIHLLHFEEEAEKDLDAEQFSLQKMQEAHQKLGHY